MERLLEYITRHPFLTGGTVALALAALAYEASRARSGGESVGPMDAVRLMNQGALLLDVRSQGEFDAGHIRDARHLPQEQVAGRRRDAQEVQGQGRRRLLRERHALRRGGARLARRRDSPRW